MKLNPTHRSLDIDWQSPPEKGHSHDMIAILWKGSEEYDKVQNEVMRRDKFKEIIMNDDKWNEDLMETELSGKCSAETFFGLKTLELSEMKKIPTSIEEIEKGKEIKKREIRKKFEKAMDGDDRTGSDIQRGWCCVHRNWCPIFSQCLPEDPLEKDHSWLVSMRRGQADTPCWEQRCEKSMRLQYEEKKVDFNAWELKACSVVSEDMRSIDGSQTNKWRIWPFTCYSIFPNHKNLPSEMNDISQEEMRFQMYEKKKLNEEEKYIKLEENLLKSYDSMRDKLKLSYYGYPFTRRHEEQFLFKYFNSLVEGKDIKGEIRCHLTEEMNHILSSTPHCTDSCTSKCALQSNVVKQINVNVSETKEEKKTSQVVEYSSVEGNEEETNGSGEEGNRKDGSEKEGSDQESYGEEGSGEESCGEEESGEQDSIEEDSSEEGSIVADSNDEGRTEEGSSKETRASHREKR